MEIIMPTDEIAWLRGLNRKMERDLFHYDVECLLGALFAILMIVYLILRVIGEVG